ncbi:MAG: hypothetical protein HZB11_01030 [Candidatus Yonathbacteria bacterium]|nr:hypothetical protein [Candidatus Yonathbacteria bacterium]
MDRIFENYKKTGYLHHAHIIEGVYADILPALLFAISKNLGIETKGNPDLTVNFYESLGINEARVLKDAQTRTAFGGARKIFIVGSESFTHEAQNALLKTFEEAPSGTHFFIIIPRAEMLLPTLLSRVLVASVNTAPKDDAKKMAEKFIDAALEDRFAMAKKMSDKKDRETADRELPRRMLDHIERILYTRMAEKHSNVTSNIFREIFQAKTYLANRGSSPKMLLEHIAMVLPLQ